MDGKYPKIPGSADPDPGHTFGKRSKFVRRGHELGASPFSARCRSCRSNQVVFLSQYRASRVPCLSGSIWLGSPPTMHNIRFSHSVGRPAFLRCFTVGQWLCPCRIGPMRASGPTEYHHIVPARGSYGAEPLGTPPRPNVVVVVGRGGARERSEGCPRLGALSAADFATTRRAVLELQAFPLIPETKEL